MQISQIFALVSFLFTNLLGQQYTLRCYVLFFRCHGLKLFAQLSRTVTSTMVVKTCCMCSAMKPQWLPNLRQLTFLALSSRPSIIQMERFPSFTLTQAHTPQIQTLSPYRMELKPPLSMLLAHSIRYVEDMSQNFLGLALSLRGFFVVVCF